MQVPERIEKCEALVFASLLLLTIGIGADVFLGPTLWEFEVMVAGLFVGWIAFFYCLGRASKRGPGGVEA